MPCNDYPPPGWERGYAQGARDRKELEAMLCGAMEVLSKHGLIKEINFKEAGVTAAQYNRWLEQHREEDRQRRERERREIERKRAKEAALKKLSAADRKALGL